MEDVCVFEYIPNFKKGVLKMPNLNLRFKREEVEKILKTPEGREWLSEHVSILHRSSNLELIDVLYDLGKDYSQETFLKRNGTRNKSALINWLNKKMREELPIWNSTTAEEALNPGGSLDKILFLKLLAVLKVPYNKAKEYILKAYICEAAAFNPSIIEEYSYMCGIMKGWHIDTIERLIKNIKDLIPDVPVIVTNWIKDKGLRANLKTRDIIRCVEEYLKDETPSSIIDLIGEKHAEDLLKLLKTRNEALLEFKHNRGDIPGNVKTEEEEEKYRHPTMTIYVVSNEEEFIRNNISDELQAYLRAKDKIRHFREIRHTMRNIIDDRFYKQGKDIFEDGVLIEIANQLYETHKHSTSIETFIKTLDSCIYRNSKNISRQLFLECLIFSTRNTISVQYINDMLNSTVFQHELDIFSLLDACVFETCHRAKREKRHPWDIYTENYNLFIAPSLKPPTIEDI